MANLWKSEDGNILIGIEKCPTLTMEVVHSIFNQLVSHGFRAVSEDGKAWYFVAPDTPARRIYAGLIAQDERVRNPTKPCSYGMGLW
jgi:hypothetical protein